MIIEDGWRFYSADFSIQASSVLMSCEGSVTLKRCPEDVEKWHALPDEVKEDENGPDIYVTGRGMTILEAIVNANLKAAHANPIN